MAKNIEQVFIMAAGRGERMRPLTDNIPKPLVKINGTTMLDLIIEKLNHFPSVKKIVVNAYYLAQKIEDHLKSQENSKIIISLETTKLETGGGLLNALPLFDKNKPILAINSDIIWKERNQKTSDLQLMMDNFNMNDTDILLGLKLKSEFWGYEGKGDFCFNSVNGEISKPKNADLNYVFTGIQIINPRIFENCPTPPFSMNYFYQKARDDKGILKKIKGLELKSDFFHIGTVSSLNEFILIDKAAI